MLSFSPLSSTPYSALSSDVLYAFASLSAEAALEPSSVIKFYDSVQFDCFSDLSASLNPIRQINVYHIMYVTTNKNHTMTLNTEEVQLVYHTSDFNQTLYIGTDTNYELGVVISADFILNAIKEF